MRFFVTGTDTGVGKTEVACGLLRAMAKGGARPAALKPYESGIASLRAPNDARRLRAAGGGWQPLETIGSARLREPLAPGLAARRLTKSQHRAHQRCFDEVVRTVAELDGPLIVEGAGGLLVPLDERHDVIDLIQALKLPVVLVARAGLGTLNHTLLSLEALERRDLPVAACVLMRSSRAKDPSIPLNGPYLKERRPGLTVLGPLPYIAETGRREARLATELEGLVIANPGSA